METSRNYYSNKNEVSDIKGVFTAVIQNKPVLISNQTAYKIISKICNMPFHSAEPRLKTVMVHMLVHYISKWPGWAKKSKYDSGQITFDKWMDTFKNYLTYRLNYAMKNDFQAALAQHLNENKINVDLRDTNVKLANAGCQTNSNDAFAPYTMIVKAPAQDYGRIVFSEGPSDTVVLKYHSPPKWETMDRCSLLNWPHINVKFTSPELVIKRNNLHQCVRYLSDPNALNKVERSQFIEEIDIIQNNIVRNSYTLNLMRQYCEKYLKIFKNHVNKTNRSALKEIMVETEAFLNQFLQDIEDLNINNQSIATNTNIIFNIGGHTYTRNKKLRNAYIDTTTLCLFEIIIPKVEISLVSFYGVSCDASGKATFRTLNDEHDLSENFVPPVLEYTCSYCYIRYLNTKLLIQHLYTKHSVEPAVLCNICKKQFNVIDLLKMRWKHICIVPSEAES